MSSFKQEMNYKRAMQILELDHEIYMDTDLDIELTINTLKKKYRMMALLYHPDKNPAEDAATRFHEIHEAYEYLLQYVETSTDENMEDDVKDNTNYKEILLRFIKSITEDDGSIQSQIFYTIIRRITQICEEKSLEFLEKLNKDVLIKIYDILYKYHHIFRISEIYVSKVQAILESRVKDDECIILHPTIEDLFEKNIYKLVIGSQTILIPLWQHEMVYEIDGKDVYVKCVPILPENITIDEENNVFIEIKYNIAELLETSQIMVSFGKKTYTISTDKIRVLRRQQLCLIGVGIPRIVEGDIFNIEKMGDIFVDLTLY